MEIVRIITYLLIILLPLSVFVRDWKYNDKRTKRYHNFTRSIAAIWLLSSIAAAGLVWNDVNNATQFQSDIDELLEGNNKLLRKISVYETDIEKLEEEAKLARRGVSAVYYFEGTIVRRDGGVVRRDNVLLVPSFNKMVLLQDEKKFLELIQLSEKLIEKYRDWPTPHVFLGTAALNLGDSAKAIKAYQYFLDNAPKEPSFRYNNYRTQVRQLLIKLNGVSKQ